MHPVERTAKTRGGLETTADRLALSGLFLLGRSVKHEIGKHRLAWIVHLATLGARRKRVAQIGQRNVRAVLGYQAGFIEPTRAAALVALDPEHVGGIVGEGESNLHRLAGRVSHGPCYLGTNPLGGKLKRSGGLDLGSATKETAVGGPASFGPILAARGLLHDRVPRQAGARRAMAAGASILCKYRPGIVVGESIPRPAEAALPRRAQASEAA